MVTNRHQQVFSTYIAIISEKIQNHTQNAYQYIYKCHQKTKQIADHGENELCGGWGREVCQGHSSTYIQTVYKVHVYIWHYQV